MPVKSKAQEAFLAIHHPAILHRWQAEAPRVFSQLPTRLHPKPAPHRKSNLLATRKP